MVVIVLEPGRRGALRACARRRRRGRVAERHRPALGPSLLDLLAQRTAGARGDGAARRERALQRVPPAHRASTPAGASASHSGERTLGRHATAEGVGCVAAGNLLADEGVPEAMVDAFEDAEATTSAIASSTRSSPAWPPAARRARCARPACVIVRHRRVAGRRPARGLARRADPRARGSVESLEAAARRLRRARARPDDGAELRRARGRVADDPMSIRSPGHPPSAPPIIGRETALGQIEEALADVEAGEQVCISVEGEPGIGKTRLLAELEDRADERGYLVLTGCATEFEREQPFGAWVDALDAYTASQEHRLREAWDAEAIGELSRDPARSAIARRSRHPDGHRRALPRPSRHARTARAAVGGAPARARPR